MSRAVALLHRATGGQDKDNVGIDGYAIELNDAASHRVVMI